MKIFIIILGILVVLFIASQIYVMTSQKNIEQYPFQLIKKQSNFEIRDYEARLFTSVKLKTKDYKTASSKGFSKLAGYIFGGNKTKEKIAMTSPVAMSLGNDMEMFFMVPKEYTKELLPAPNSAEITFKEMPKKRVAAIAFGGWANDGKIQKYKQQLIMELREAKIAHTNTFFFLGYNAPFEMINRKNEVIVELAE